MRISKLWLTTILLTGLASTPARAAALLVSVDLQSSYAGQGYTTTGPEAGFSP